MKILSKKLKLVREKLGMSQTQFAEKAGLSQRDVSLLENGKKEFIPTPYIRFMNQVGVDLNWLFEEEPEESIEVSSARGLQQLNEPQENFGMKRRRKNDLADFNKPLSKIRIVESSILYSYPDNCQDELYLKNLPFLFLPEDEFQQMKFRCFQIDDDSMLETIEPFDYVIGKFTEFDFEKIKSGYIYIIVKYDEVLVRRIQSIDQSNKKLILTADNQNYPALEVSFDNIIELWYVKAKLSLSNSYKPYNLVHSISNIQTQLEAVRSDLESLKASNKNNS